MRTQQETFNTVVEHLIKQGKRATKNTSEGNTSCLYLADDGSKCAIGCLIADEHYDKSIEGKTAETLIYSDNLPDIISDLSVEGMFEEEMVSFYSDLQYIHDYVSPEDWSGRLRGIAIQRDLEIPDCIKKN
jgi:hypothetical protein